MIFGASDNTYESKRVETLVFSELLKRGVLPYRTSGSGIGISTVMGRRLELQTISPSDDSTEGRLLFFRA